MKSTALTLTSDKYFERYAKFITEADGDPQRITSADDLEKYDVLVLVDILLLVLFLFSSTVKRARETIDSIHYYNIVSQR